MTRTEIITRLCEMVADIADIREQEFVDKELYEQLSVIEINIQEVMHLIQECGK